MLYNRLVTNQFRVAHYRESGKPFDEDRASGRSTAIALEAVAQAIRNPQKWIEVRDHIHGREIRHVEVAKMAMAIALNLNLMYFERDRNRIRSCHMTPNQLELK